MIKVYHNDFVYIYHQTAQLHDLKQFIQDNITEDNYLLKWQDDEDLVGIVRNDDLLECCQFIRNENYIRIQLIIRDYGPFTNYNQYQNQEHEQEQEHLLEDSPQFMNLINNNLPSFQLTDQTPIFNQQEKQEDELNDQQLMKFIQENIQGLYQDIQFQTNNNTLSPRKIQNRKKSIRQSNINRKSLDQTVEFDQDEDDNNNYWCDECTRSIPNEINERYCKQCMKDICDKCEKLNCIDNKKHKFND